jgi:hypothetical protein
MKIVAGQIVLGGSDVGGIINIRDKWVGWGMGG